MALRNIMLDGEEVLKKQCRTVTKFDDRLAELLDDMAETVIENNGLGLAAPQVGVLRRAFVMLEEGDEDEFDEACDEAELEDIEALENIDEELKTDDIEPCANKEDEEDYEDDFEDDDYEAVIVEFINPEILETAGDESGYEGCLSFPGKFGAIKRPNYAKVRAQNRHGEWFEYEGKGILARCLCHEIDHLNGVTITDLAEYFYDPANPHDLDKTME
jgi:peptide deformylase